MSYKIIALIGKSGAGKDTILHEVVKECPQAHEIVSCTSRPPREGEVDGINYHFLENEEFAIQLYNNQFAEATIFNDWAYGTRFCDLDENKINIGVFNPDGIYALSECSNINLTVYYVIATDKCRLIRQLEREQEPDVTEIIRRYSTDNTDFADLDFDYEYLINESPQEYLEAAQCIIKDNFK